MKKITNTFIAATLAFGFTTSAVAQQVEIEKLSELNEVLDDIRGDYGRKDGLYKIILPSINTNGEDLDCTVIKDTIIVYNLQSTPQAAGVGISHSCNWLPPKPQ